MNDVEANAIADGSWHNRRRMTPGTTCGCFHCLATFLAEDVQAWVDEGSTALCPRCGIDSVVPGMTDAAALQDLRDHRFGRSPQPSAAEGDTIPRRASGR
jgi:hypothetical protein